MIELTHLTKTYETTGGPSTVIDDISLSVAAGEILAIVGPSGAGKSTLSKLITLLERPTSGTVSVDGLDLTALNRTDLRVARQRIGTIFQSAALFTRRTAAQNVALPLEYLGVRADQRDARVAELLERVGLSDRVGHYPGQLSGGQKQRVGIARALALRPSVLLADEATSGLDPRATQSILALLRELRDDLGITVILITHEMDVVRQLADRVARLDSGRIVEDGRTAELVSDPESALGHELLPLPEAGPPADQSTPWDLFLTGQQVPTDWPARAGVRLGQPVHVLSAAIEHRGGRYTGRARVSLASAPEEEIREAFADLGIVATPKPAGPEVA